MVHGWDEKPFNQFNLNPNPNPNPSNHQRTKGSEKSKTLKLNVNVKVVPVHIKPPQQAPLTVWTVSHLKIKENVQHSQFFRALVADDHGADRKASYANLSQVHDLFPVLQNCTFIKKKKKSPDSLLNDSWHILRWSVFSSVVFITGSCPI